MDRKLTEDDIKKYRKGQLSIINIVTVIIELLIIVFFSSKIIKYLRIFSFSPLLIIKLVVSMIVLLITVLMAFGSISKLHEGINIRNNIGLVKGTVQKKYTGTKGKNVKSYHIILKVDNTYRYDPAFNDFNEIDMRISFEEGFLIEVRESEYDELNVGDNVECIMGLMSRVILEIKKLI